MIKSTYDEKENIIYLERMGEVSLDEILNNINNLNLHFKDYQSLYILEEIGSSYSAYSIQELDTVLEILKQLTPKYKEIRSAMVVDIPNDTALSVWFEKLAREIKNYQFKTFSTKETAILWLKSGDYYSNKP